MEEITPLLFFMKASYNEKIKEKKLHGRI